MPIYEYRCKSCGKDFEELVTRDSGQPLPCPSCESNDTEKLMSVFGGISMGAKSGGCGAADSCGAAGSSCCSSGTCPMAQ